MALWGWGSSDSYDRNLYKNSLLYDDHKHVEQFKNSLHMAAIKYTSLSMYEQLVYTESINRSLIFRYQALI